MQSLTAERCRSIGAVASHQQHISVRAVYRWHQHWSAAPVPQPSATRACARASSNEYVSAALQTQNDQGEATVSGRPMSSESWWRWKHGDIRYFKSGNKGPALLMVHGFGVGAYHYDNNMKELSNHFQVWSIDLLGQGKSWPFAATSSSTDSSSDSLDEAQQQGKLFLSIDTWTEQLKEFIEQNVGEPAYIVGNSLGGYLAVSLAANHPELAKGIVLLNATPFWSFKPPAQQAQGLWQLLPTDGSVPVSQTIKAPIERLWWDNLRSPATIRSMLQLVYSHKQAADDTLVQAIVDSTLHPAALDSFASIVLAPKSRHDFDAMLRMLACPVCLAYGKDDPWVVPLWGQRFKRAVPAAAYYELAPAGHCPHHEAPNATNKVILDWVAAVEGQQDVPHSTGEVWEVAEAGGRRVRVCHVDGSPRNVFERLDAAVWRVRQAVMGGAGAAAGSGA